MKISDRFKKQYFKRRINPDSDINHIPLNSGYYVNPNIPSDEGVYIYLTQEDFCRENDPLAHDINSRYMSTRPIYDVSNKTDSDGNILRDENGKPIPEWRVVDFEPVETVRFGLQKRINTSKAAYLAGNGFWICHEDTDHNLGDILNSWKDSAGLDVAIQEVANSCCLTGDGAIYQYVKNGQLRYEVFSYLKGDILFPDFDENRNFVLTRLYTLRGRRAVDIYSCDRIQTWIEGDKENDKNLSWFMRFSGWFAKGLNWDSAKMSEDGWRCLADTPTQTPKGMNPVTYWRVADIPSGCVEQEICALEKSCSFVADGVRANSQAPLFIKAVNIDSLPRTDSTGKIIGVKGAVDELAASDAKFLTPPNLSDIATIDIANKEKSILQTSMSTNINSDIFRSADPSSASIKLLFTDTLIWCKNEFAQFYYAPLVDMVEVTKALVALIEGNDKIASMRTSCGMDFWIPQNDTETLKRELDKVAYKVKSRKSAMSDIGNNHIEDYEQILKEMKEELDIKTRIPAVAKAEVEKEYQEPQETIVVKEDDNDSSSTDSPDNSANEDVNNVEPKVDNKAPGKVSSRVSK